MLARPRGVRRPRTRGRLAPLALNGNPGVSPKELRPRYPGIAASIRPCCGSVSVQCGCPRRAMARRLTSVEMTSTTGLRVETGQHVFLPGGEEDCHVGPDLLDVGLVDACVGVSLDSRCVPVEVGPARDGLGDRARRLAGELAGQLLAWRWSPTAARRWPTGRCATSAATSRSASQFTFILAWTGLCPPPAARNARTRSASGMARR